MVCTIKKNGAVRKKMATEMPDKVQIVRVNADENTELCKALNVSALPVLKLYKNRKVVWENLGFVSEEQVKSRIIQYYSIIESPDILTGK